MRTHLPCAASPVYSGIAACAAGIAQDKERLASLPGVVPGKYDRRTAACLTRAAPMPLTDVALRTGAEYAC